jgi:hypothetical protein
LKSPAVDFIIWTLSFELLGAFVAIRIIAVVVAPSNTSLPASNN